jgi:hypothetical protein
MENRTLTEKQDQRFGVKGLTYVIPERLLMAKRITWMDLPVMLVDVNLDHLKAFFVEQATALVRSRVQR